MGAGHRTCPRLSRAGLPSACDGPAGRCVFRRGLLLLAASAAETGETAAPGDSFLLLEGEQTHGTPDYPERVL